ncbi:polysaccharide deacetylase family protein [Paraburkholderia phosphatilytica]|uniref:polysaccharide deacetylase family protein n=1 Tax=Paraburkholderia phosphatilytica TaxID=2282883 RepID=UPI000E4DD6FE|nr:polysaccharide deacetylase family protein [Paraburkholderia phosphatilytica]
MKAPANVSADLRRNVGVAAPSDLRPLLPEPRRWNPSPYIKGAAALHVGATAVAVAAPGVWPWALGAVAASHLAATAAGLWPKSALLGENWTRLPAGAGRTIALTIDDGPNPEVTPPLLDLLDRHDVRATFFCIGVEARRHPKLVEAIVARGHAVENHSERHRHTFSLLGPRAMLREIEAGQRTLAEIAGTPPLFFRAPAGLRNPFLEPVLSRLGLRLASWTRRGFDTRTREPATITRRLLNGLAPRDILLVHDGHPARDAAGRAVVLDVLPAVLEAASAAQLRFTTLRAALANHAEKSS